jgi:hypothetical protein
LASQYLNSTIHFETAGVSVAGAGVAAGVTVTDEVSVTVGVPATTSGVEAAAGTVSTEAGAASSFFEQAERASRTVSTNSERIIYILF